MLTWKCASRHNVFDIATSKSGPTLRCFVHFDLETCSAPQRRVLFRHSNLQQWSGSEVFRTFYFQKCFAPQRHALFRHTNFQKWPESDVFLAFLIPKVIRAKAACNFSALIWSHGSSPAALGSLLFDPPEPQIIGKNAVNLDFPTFSRTCIFFPLTLSLLWSAHFFSSPPWLFPPLLFHLSILSEVWLLNFLRWYDMICIVSCNSPYGRQKHITFAWACSCKVWRRHELLQVISPVSLEVFSWYDVYGQQKICLLEVQYWPFSCLDWNFHEVKIGEARNTANPHISSKTVWSTWAIWLKHRSCDIMFCNLLVQDRDSADELMGDAEAIAQMSLGQCPLWRDKQSSREFTFEHLMPGCAIIFFSMALVFQHGRFMSTRTKTSDNSFASHRLSTTFPQDPTPGTKKKHIESQTCLENLNRTKQDTFPV